MPYGFATHDGRSPLKTACALRTKRDILMPAEKYYVTNEMATITSSRWGDAISRAVVMAGRRRSHIRRSRVFVCVGAHREDAAPAQPRPRQHDIIGARRESQPAHDDVTRQRKPRRCAPHGQMRAGPP